MGTTPARPRLALLALATALALLGPVCKKPANRPPAVPQTPTGATTGDRDTIYEFRSAAVDPDNDRVALRFAWGNGDTTGWSAWAASGDTIITFYRWESAGTYVVTAQAKDDSGLVSEWSAGLTTGINNRAPTAPAAPTGPSTSRAGTLCRFTSRATDPNGDDVALRFAWGDGDTSDWSAWVASGDSITASHTWHRANTYRVVAQAKDRPGAVSAWSLSGTIAISNQAPKAPATPTGPSAALTDRVCGFRATSTDPNGDSIALRFSWDDGDTTEWSPLVASGDTVAADHSWATPGTYDVTVQAKDCADSASVWSTAKSMTIAAPAPGVIKWNYWTGGAPSSPAIGPDGTVCFGSRDDCVYALDPDGALRWRYRTLNDVISSPAIGADGTVYVGSDDHNVYALSPNGELKWRYQTGAAVRTSPAIGSDGTVYAGSSDSCLYALNPDGSLKWRYRTGDAARSSPAVGPDGRVYFGSNDDFLYALNPDGTLLWSYETGRNVYSTPALDSDGALYFGSDDNYVYALNSDGTLKWRYRTGDDVGHSPAIGYDGTIYVGSEDFNVYALNPDGTLRWRYGTGSSVSSSPAIGSEGTVYVGSDYNYLYALNPDGTLRWRCKMAGDVSSSPAVDPGSTVYVGSEPGYMNAVISTGHLANTPWPKFHHDNRNSGRAGGP